RRAFEIRGRRPATESLAWRHAHALGAGARKAPRGAQGMPMKINDEAMTPEDDELAGVLESYLADLEAGRPTDLSQFTAEHPAIAERLQTCLSSLNLVEQAVGSSVLPPIHGAAASKRLGDFQIVREIGRGGMGIVYEAEQISLQRRVALKVLPFGVT